MEDKRCENCKWLEIVDPGEVVMCLLRDKSGICGPCDKWEFGDTYAKQLQERRDRWKKRENEERWKRYAARKVKEYVEAQKQNEKAARD